MKTTRFLILLLMNISLPSLSSALKGEQLLLHTLVRKPLCPVTGKPPVIILLHGVGGNEENLFVHAGQLPEESLIISARAPFMLSPGSYAWFHVDFATGKPVINPEEAEKSRTILIQYINQVLEKYDADPQRVFLLGFSQGAIMSYSVALSRPEKVKGMVALSGRILLETAPKLAPAKKLQQLHIFIAHGTADAVLPISYGQEAKALIENSGAQFMYKEYPMGHEIIPEAWRDIGSWIKGLL